MSFISDFSEDVDRYNRIEKNCAGDDAYTKVDSPYWFKSIELTHGLSEESESECAWFIDLGKFSGMGYLNISISGFKVS